VVDKGDTDANSIWHHRYGHFCFQHLSFFSRLGMIVGLLDIQEEEGRYATCLTMEQHKEVVDTSRALRANIVLQVVQVEICGPTNTPSLSGAR
jgi:hypothetical protein